MALNVVCCVKQVPDPEAPSSAFRVDEAARKASFASGTALVISQFDALAVEAALRLRDAGADMSITVVSLGPPSARDVIKSSLAMGADEGILLDDAALLEGDSYVVALALSKAIEKIGNVDLVLCGRQATDWDFGVTGIAIAEMLGLPSLTISRSVKLSDGRVRAERVLGDAFETVEAPLPAVVTVSNELGEPRYPKLAQIMAAARKQVTVWTATDLGLTPEQLQPRLRLERLFLPKVESRCEFIEGDTAAEMAASLARRLREARVI